MDLEPFGFPLTNLLQAYTLATLSNTVGGGKAVSKTKREPYRTEEFLLRPGDEPKSQPKQLTEQQTVSVVSGIFAALGARRAAGVSGQGAGTGSGRAALRKG